ncbi:MAG TPA: formyltetrahydrofolate deformylase [Acidimicrobiales bacterium]|nr:formyltetrahydrofolate deformylase [Acidimicrobiales bacterium]
MQLRRYVLTITCPDRIGIVAAVTGFIAGHGGSVLEAAQHGDLDSGLFFLRIEVTADSLPFGPAAFREAFAPLAAGFAMEWQLADSAERKRVVLFVSREDHCLADLLHRWRSGDLECDMVGVISNHEDLRSFVEWHGIPFRWVPVGAEPAAAAEAFAEIDRIVDEARADVIVLARYMQIVPDWFCDRHHGRIINIHHSFLPSFAGARPYHQAFTRGVKLIGATCHYVTPALDEGPIIEQDTRRIDHADSPDELRRVGRDIERTVLARGLRWHLEDRVLLSGSKTVVFT